MENLNSGETKAEGVKRHRPVRRLRGKASDYPCCRCWEDDVVVQADVWATIHGETGSDPWSDYVPLCNGCHRNYDKPFQGEKHPSSRLTDEDVLSIRRKFHEAGIRRGVDPASPVIKQLAIEFNVHERHIRNIIDNVAWTHLRT